MNFSTWCSPKAKSGLFLAASLCDGVEDNNLKQVTSLLRNHEANPNVLIPLYGITPFHLVVGNEFVEFAEEVTKLFLRHGGNPNIRSVDGMTPVHVAAAWGRLTILELLLVNGGDPLQLDDDDCSPFHYAFQGKHYETIVLLSNYCNDSLQEDEDKPKFKRELDKVIVNKGDVKAEYIVSDDSVLDSSVNCSSSLTSSPYGDTGIYTDSKENDSSSLNTDFVTVRKHQEKTKKKYIEDNHYDTKFDNTENNARKLSEEDIVSSLSSPMASTSPLSDECDDVLQPNLSKRKEISLTFMRPQKYNLYSAQAKCNLNNKCPTLRVPKKHIGLPQCKKNTIISHPFAKQLNNAVNKHVLSKNVAGNESKSPIQSSTASSYNRKPSKIFEETIISKSPNLCIEINRKKKLIDKINEKYIQKPYSQSNLTYEAESFVETKDITDDISLISNDIENFNDCCDQEVIHNSSINVNNDLHDKINSLTIENSISPIHEKSFDHSYEMVFSHKSQPQVDFISGIGELEHSSNEKDERTAETSEYSDENLHVSNSNISIDSLECVNGSILSSKNITFTINENLQNMNVSNCNNIFLIPKVPIQNNVLRTSDLTTRVGSDTFLSVEEEYKYEDAEEGIVLLERRLCVTPSCASSDGDMSYYSCSTTKSEPLPKEILCLDQATLRARLTDFGDKPGPITQTTRHLYLKRLHKLQKQSDSKPRVLTPSLQLSVANSERQDQLVENALNHLSSFLLSIDWFKDLEIYETVEEKVFHEFANPDPTRRWREGTTKASFNYLLLDPRITRDLPRRTVGLDIREQWSIFLSAVFYIGKGKRTRPYAHLYDAFKIWVSKDVTSNVNPKIQRILDIWNEGKGVIALHVFQNTIPVEAYTREAAMIEALSTKKLCNCKAGEYYGVVSTWRSKEKRELGRYLLYKAMQILLFEGERQIFPDNL